MKRMERENGGKLLISVLKTQLLTVGDRFAGVESEQSVWSEQAITYVQGYTNP